MDKLHRRRYLIFYAFSIVVILLGLKFDIVFSQAPTVVTGAATGIGETSATLNGTVNANGHMTTVVFEYGQDTNFGMMWTANQSPVSGSTDTAVNATVVGLSADTTYYFRVKAESADGTVYGEAMSFDTLTPTAIVVLDLQPRQNMGLWFWAAVVLIIVIILTLSFGQRHFHKER